MNWKLIFGLSLFGLAMAFATVSLIPNNVEIYFWLLIYIICAWLIAKNAPGNYFGHGFLVSLVNCVWITAVHIIMIDSYSSHHADMMKQFMDHKMPLHGNPRRQMLAFAPFFGIVFGLILGLFAFIASKIIKKPVIAK